jgi:hypothetical protein
VAAPHSVEPPGAAAQSSPAAPAASQFAEAAPAVAVAVAKAPAPAPATSQSAFPPKPGSAVTSSAPMRVS